MLSGEINERQLRFMNVNRARENIRITLLSYSSMQHACISSVCTIIPSAADLRERCTICGAGDTSISHPDYIDWVSELFVHAQLHVL